jgi:hypothetical protein
VCGGGGHGGADEIPAPTPLSRLPPAPAHGDAGPAVLRQPLLGHVHPGQDLQPADQRVVQGRVGGADVPQDAVDPVPDDEAWVGRRVRVEVQVARPLG